MKYIYKHGNQFWYQRAIPLKIQKIIGKTTIKVCLKTNKISTAVQRSKLQALEHKKMFQDIIKQNYLSKVFYKKNLHINKYQLIFLEDYEDYVTNIFFYKRKIKENVKNNIKPVLKFKIKKKLIKLKNFYLTLRINPCFFKQFLKISLKAKEHLIHLSKKKM